jgi:hypothetical protein
MDDAVMEQRDEPATRTALGTLLIERGFLDAERLDEALRIGADTGERLGEVVVRMGWASEDDLAKTLADQWHLGYVERSAISFDGGALSRISREEATRLEALPMQVKEDGAVVVALAEPTDSRFLALRELLGDRIDCVVVAKSAIDAALRSELLHKDAGSTPSVAAAPGGAAHGDEQQNNGLVVSPESAETTGEPTASDFDEVAKTLSEGLSAQLGSLRAIVVKAEDTRERDRAEIARLTAELANLSAQLNDRTAELSDRNGTIESMQQKLREFADTLEHRT